MTLRVTLDTTFSVTHFFAKSEDLIGKTREILRRSILQGSRGVVPTIMLAEFYAQAGEESGGL